MQQHRVGSEEPGTMEREHKRMIGTLNSAETVPRRGLIPLLLLLGCAVAAGCSSIRMPFPDDDESGKLSAGDSVPTIAYQVQLSGVDPQEKRLLETLRQSSTALRLRDRPPPTLAGLDRRAEDDVTRFSAILRSFGFYDGKVTYSIKEAPGGMTAPGTPESAVASETASRPPSQPVTVDYLIEPGRPYLLATVALFVDFPDRTSERPMNEEELNETGLTLGMRAEAAPIIQAEERAVEVLHKRGYPLAKAGKRRVTANTSAKTLSVTYRLIAGARANFGAVKVTGAEEVDPQLIAGYRTWETGTRYSSEEVAATRRELTQSGLFLAASVNPGEAVNEQGEIPIDIQVTEREHRTISGGLDYSTADGAGAQLLWEHRNLLGAGERLRLHVEASQLQQGMDAGFNKPQFLDRRQALVIGALAKSYNTEAYEGEVVESSAGIERRLSKYWKATAGVTAEHSALSGADSPNESFYLGGIRGILRRDSTDNPLDATKGSRLELAVLPYTSLGGATTQFISTSLSGSHYLPLDRASRYLLAGRGQIGTILGEELSSLPSHKRFYAGGGGSVRGYAYQLAGPLDEDNDPTGGLSILTLGLEFRARVSNSISVVPFVDGGNVFENSQIGNLDLLWAAGLGLRYYTAIGPLRLDFAVPLEKREGVDDDFQIYFSIGQAF